MSSLLSYMFYFTPFNENVLQNGSRVTASNNSALKINFSGCTKEISHGLGKKILSDTILCKVLP